jgi:ATP-dependent DNA helicase RecG
MGFNSSIDLLRRVLDLERRRGYTNGAVIGGLERFLERWLAGQPAGARACTERLIAPLIGYAARSVEERQAAIEEVLAALDRPAPVVPAGAVPVAPTPSAAPVRLRSRTRAVSRRRSDAGNAEAAADSLEASVLALRGVGSANAERLRRLGVRTIRDLLYHFPRYHLDYRAAKPIRDLSFEGFETVLATIWDVKAERKAGGLIVIRATLADATGTAEAVWIRRKDYISSELRPGREVAVSGEARIVGGHPVFKDPEWEPIGGAETLHTGRLVPVYPLVDGLNERFLRRLIKQTLDQYAPLVPDPLPAAIRDEFGLLELPVALMQAHFPDSDRLLAAGKRRLAFDEWLVVQVGVLRRRRAWELGDPAPALGTGADRVPLFLESLPFRLTGAQERALAAIRERIERTRPMSLLLQGDVGSGKTVVAAAAMVQAAASGYQAALMAPTEILAEQHYQTLLRLLAPMGDRAPQIVLLTGSVKGTERRRRYQAIAEGAAEIVVGTHALVQEGLTFSRLGLVVIDEQHRFGVHQRSILRQKGYNPHVLVMSATPIPRTLALTLYGDLDLIVIDELPPGRQRIKTRCLRPTDRPRAYMFVRQQVAEGHQAFIICPLVEESERLEARAAIDEYQRLQREVFPDLRLGLLHGRMKPAEKELVMRQFQRRELDVLVSTAVVEVGIDVPNATVMLIEGANRFGLAQLHQFRGRVGRGEAPSYCLLIADSPSEVAIERLKILERTHDGFDLAEQDLRLRGPGEFLGTRQSGLPGFKVARWGDGEVIEHARRAAEYLTREDPDLDAPEHCLIRRMVERFWQQDLDLS